MIHRPTAARPPRRQRGATLIIALIMLVALGMLAAWAAKSSTVNLRVVGNNQARVEAFTAAQAAIESTISSPTFSEQPAAVAARPIQIDLDGDGRPDMSATLSPAPICYRARVVRNTELDAATAAGRACMGSGGGPYIDGEGGSSTGSGDSLCADSEWNVRVVASDNATGASVTVNQGVALRGLKTDAANACP